MSSGGISRNAISLLGNCISKSGRAIIAVESNKHPRIAANSSIKGHSSWLLNLNTWSLVSQKVAATCRKSSVYLQMLKRSQRFDMKRLQFIPIIPIKTLKKSLHQLKGSLSHDGFGRGMKSVSLLGPFIGIRLNPGGMRNLFS